MSKATKRQAKKSSKVGGSLVRPLPGTRKTLAPELSNYIVVLKEDNDKDAAQGRRQFYESGVARTTSLQRRILNFLRERGVGAEKCSVGEPTVFPLFSLSCTPDVAEMVESLPEVDEVVLDRDDLRLTR